jgi:hypothetical protein
MSPAKHGQMIGSPRGSRDRRSNRTRLTSGVSKVKNVFQPVGDTACTSASAVEMSFVATHRYGDAAFPNRTQNRTKPLKVSQEAGRDNFTYL